MIDALGGSCELILKLLQNPLTTPNVSVKGWTEFLYPSKKKIIFAIRCSTNMLVVLKYFTTSY